MSSLARVEALVHVRGRVAARMLSAAAARRLIARLDQVLQEEPHELVPCPPGIIEIAETQVRLVPKSTCRRALDRLHLATMQILAVQRLLTNDDAQARAARGLGFETVRPRGEARDRSSAMARTETVTVVFTDLRNARLSS